MTDLEPTVVDSHCHVWQRWPYEPPVPDPLDRAVAAQLIYEMDAHGVSAATIVSANIGGNDDNNAYVAEAVADHPGRLFQLADFDSHWSSTYHVAGAARRLSDLCDQLEPVGITHYLQREDDGWFTSDEGASVFEVATERGLLVSLAASWRWYRSLLSVSDRFPAVPIVLHHLGGLRPHELDYPEQLEALRQLAARPNLFVKVSGWRYASSSPHEYPYPDVIDTLRFLYESFGTRLCWGSNYPVERPFTTYQQTMNLLRRHADFITDADRSLILGGTMAQLLARYGTNE
ncbi:putative TIM-barrel fold metal-dependent hydrolase [Ilumatobacter fluminis]|uniref:Putative TIM-barrel fold metal-dependent hydrolase n=1 Tax=Ilumatobacter fluminis TaxID=467091 RepID=A0A4R7HV99_9ACTN|nr:amidohydrolase family protein [Ilumatobacter fluminis]TDT14907.1 putative TIM-barrel fold metal-dependent hydrolase [Ilumatobacter fluminis]